MSVTKSVLIFNDFKSFSSIKIPFLNFFYKIVIKCLLFYDFFVRIILSKCVKRGENMPNIKSAKKRVKTDAKKKVANKNNASSMRTAIKKVKAEIKNENKELATAKFNEANKKIDKAVKAGVIKKNTAARNKSKLMKAINNIK
jgi:ribosomal protein S20